MHKPYRLILVLLLAAGLAGCESRTDRTDGGGVLLSISDFDGLPIRVSVNLANNLVQVEEFQIQNVPKDPTGVTSSLMNVEITSYEVTYSRADAGSRVPPPLVGGLFGVAAVASTFTVENLHVMGTEQFERVPISDLFFVNGGFDKETGQGRILLNFHVRFFGRTLSGDAVQTEPASFKVEFVP